MNERLIIRLTEGGRHLPINSLGNDGVRLKNETDATPREVLFEFDGDGTAMKTRLDWVRSSHGWVPREFKLDRHLSDGNLMFTGVDSRALPAGLYWFRLTIADLNLPKTKIRVEIPKDGTAEVEVKVTKDQRDIRLTSKISAFDADVRRVIEATASRGRRRDCIRMAREQAAARTAQSLPPEPVGETTHGPNPVRQFAQERPAFFLRRRGSNLREDRARVLSSP